MTPFLIMSKLNFSKLKNSTLPDIPEEWIYKYYLSLSTDLTGRPVKIKSAFQSENTPSMFLYVRDGRYVWKDHSSGYYGDALELAKKLFEQSRGSTIAWEEVYRTIRHDFEKWKGAGNKVIQGDKETEYSAYELVCNVQRRNFESYDNNYWGQFGITVPLLERYNVIPLKHFQLGKHYKDSGLTKWFKRVTEEWWMYGFYDNTGSLLKIYCPYSKDLKHVSLKPVLLGREQLENRETLIVASSMKDMLTLAALQLEIDIVAPMSEKTLINAQDIRDLKNLYTNIITMFDNDKTGVMAMLMYKAIYDIDFAYLPYGKDISEYRHFNDPLTVKHEITKIISKKIFKGIFSDEEIKD